MLGGRLHGLLVAAVLDSDRCLKDIAASLLQWSHLLQGRKIPPRLPRLLFTGGIVQHAVQKDDNVIVDEDIPLNQILGYKPGMIGLARRS
jgi:hypothetical protein